MLKNVSTFLKDNKGATRITPWQSDSGGHLLSLSVHIRHPLGAAGYEDPLASLRPAPSESALQDTILGTGIQQ